MIFDWETTFRVLAMAQGLLLSIAFAAGHGGSRNANRFFAALMLAVTIDLGFGLYFSGDFFIAFPHLIRVNSPLKYLIGPLLFLYVRSLVREESGFRRLDWLHFSPLLIRAAWSLPFYLRDGGFKIDWLIAFSQKIPLESYLLGIGWRVQCFIYILLTLHLLIQYTKVRPSETNRRVWLTFLIFIFAISWGSQLGRYLRLIDIQIEQTGAWFDTLILYVIGYMGLRKPDVILGRTERKYRKSPLTGEKSHLYLNKLRLVMERDRLFLDNELTLPTLAERMHLPGYQLSQLINEQLGCNFHDFVNGYRVEEVKRVLDSGTAEHLSLQGIALQAGFKSTSAFNTAFKKFSGQTPSQYRTSVLSAGAAA